MSWIARCVRNKKGSGAGLSQSMFKTRRIHRTSPSMVSIPRSEELAIAHRFARIKVEQSIVLSQL